MSSNTITFTVDLKLIPRTPSDLDDTDTIIDDLSISSGSHPSGSPRRSSMFTPSLSNSMHTSFDSMRTPRYFTPSPFPGGLSASVSESGTPSIQSTFREPSPRGSVSPPLNSTSPTESRRTPTLPVHPAEEGPIMYPGYLPYVPVFCPILAFYPYGSTPHEPPHPSFMHNDNA